ncbi:TetR/AcrR family transcriptional regulator [Haliangium sp.]|uniref:TetR/AcrR family transcriptional regulator n=1 Tax=Haliangium sp. TaxID=2663208 RepID=UPI003D0B568F
MTLAKQRARRPEDKETRRRDIIQAATELLAERRFAEIKMIDIARQARLAKGTLFLYFPTKETLFLDVIVVELEQWLGEVDERLSSGRGRWTAARVTRVLTETLADRDTLTRLLTLVSSVLENNADVDRIIVFKTRLLQRLISTGALLEERLSFLGKGGGVMLLLRYYAMVVGLRQLADPGDTARQALARMYAMSVGAGQRPAAGDKVAASGEFLLTMAKDHVPNLMVNFQRELEGMLATYLRGLDSGAD